MIDKDAWDEFEEVCRECGTPETFTNRVMERIGLVSLSKLYFHAQNGDMDAAKFLVNKWLPEVEKTPADAASTMTLEEVNASLAAEGYIEADWSSVEDQA